MCEINKFRLAPGEGIDWQVVVPPLEDRGGWGRQYELGREEDAAELVGGVQYGCSDGEKGLYLEKPQTLNP